MKVLLKSTSLAVVLTLIGLCGCGETKSYNPKRAIELNDIALGTHWANPDSQIALLKEAISYDSTYVIAYGNLAGAYQRKRDFPNMSLALEKILALKPKSAATMLLLGLLADQDGEQQKARLLYHHAIETLDEKLLSGEKDSTSILIDRAILLVMTDREHEGRLELDRVLPQLPANDPRRVLLEPFTKHQFMKSILEGVALNGAR